MVHNEKAEADEIISGWRAVERLTGRSRVQLWRDVRAGLFPRDMTLAPDGTLLVSNFDSGQVEAVDMATVPGTPGVAG